MLDLTTLNRFLKMKTFKMVNPESIRLFRKKEEWVTSLYFSDAYFYIPVSQIPLSEPKFPLLGLFPFGLSITPMELTIVVKGVKLIDQGRNKRIHQYLDDWLIRAQGSCLETQTLLTLCQDKFSTLLDTIMTGLREWSDHHREATDPSFQTQLPFCKTQLLS